MTGTKLSSMKAKALNVGCLHQAFRVGGVLGVL